MGLDLVLRWLHILSAITLVGGTFFMRFAYYSQDASEAVQTHAEGVRKRWSRLVGASTGFLLLSGIVNFVRIVGNYEISNVAFPGSIYHMLFGIKFLLAMLLFFFSAALSGRSGLAQRLRQREKTWLTISVILAVIIVCLAGIMKLADRSPKSAQTLRSTHTVAVASTEPLSNRA